MERPSRLLPRRLHPTALAVVLLCSLVAGQACGQEPIPRVTHRPVPIAPAPWQGGFRSTAPPPVLVLRPYANQPAFIAPFPPQLHDSVYPGGTTFEPGTVFRGAAPQATWNFDGAQQGGAQVVQTPPPLLIPPQGTPGDDNQYETFKPGEPVSSGIDLLQGTEPADFNLKLEVGEALLSRFVNHRQTTGGPVRDRVLGADVYGEQTTNLVTRLDMVPSAKTAKLNLVLDGQTTNQTIGVTPQATVSGHGLHQFTLTKPIEFDGIQFRTQTPAGHVTPMIQNDHIQTQADGIPIIGAIANRIARNAAEQRRPQAEQIAAQRITEAAAGRFNKEVDAGLARLNIALRTRIRPRLQRFDLLPASQGLSTTDDLLSYRMRFGEMPAGSSPAPVLAGGATGEMIAFTLHESLLNNLLDKAELGGQSFSDVFLGKLVEVIRDLFPREGPLDLASPAKLREKFAPLRQPDTEDGMATIILDDVNPVHIRLDDGRLLLTIRAIFRPAIGPEVPLQRIVIPYVLNIEDEMVILQPGEVDVSAVDPDEGGQLAKLAPALIEQQVKQRLSPVEMPRTTVIPIDGNRQLSLRFNGATATGGWATLSFSAGP